MSTTNIFIYSLGLELSLRVAFNHLSISLILKVSPGNLKENYDIDRQIKVVELTKSI